MPAASAWHNDFVGDAEVDVVPGFGFAGFGEREAELAQAGENLADHILHGSGMARGVWGDRAGRSIIHNW